jgi:hypothetical protein
MQRIDPYEVQEEIGHGGMRVIDHTIDPIIVRTVGLKLINMPAGEGGQNQEFFRDRLCRGRGRISGLGFLGVTVGFSAERNVAYAH